MTTPRMFTSQQALAWVRATAAAAEERADELTRLDQEIGDGDHGINLQRGFRAVTEKLPGVPEGDLAALLKTVAMALIGKVGGASGPLYGSFFLAASKSLGNAAEVDDETLAKALRSGYDAVVARGKAEPGDKTILDAMQPALAALDAALERGEDLGAALEGATAAAAEGAQATVGMVARKGRASYLGERSRGHQDPGATSTHLILAALSDAVNDRAAP